MSTLVAFGLLAGGLLLLGRWGIRNATRLAPQSLPENERQRRARVMRRGSVACWVAAGALLAVGFHAWLAGV